MAMSGKNVLVSVLNILATVRYIFWNLNKTAAAEVIGPQVKYPEIL